jgi:predicted RNase H-like HicB family nuclease
LLIEEKFMEYTVVIRKAPDGYYIASCPLISEVHAQGESYEECLANIKEAIELCLEFRRERDEEIPDEVGARRVKVAV